MTVDDLPLIPVVFYAGTDPRVVQIASLAWNRAGEGVPSILELFSHHERTDCAPCPGGQECTKKFGTGFSPVVLRVPYREDENVEAVSMLMFDIDKVTRAELEAVCDRLEGVESFIVSTHSHLSKGPDHCCARIGIPLTQALSVAEYRHVHREVRKRYTLEWLRPGMSTLSGADQTAVNDPSRFYFLPNAPIGAEVIVGHESGALLDIDELLRNHTPEPPRPVSYPKPPYPVPPAGPADMEALRQALREYRPKWKNEAGEIPRKELARRVVAGEPLTRQEEVGLRDKSCLRLGKVLAHCLPAETSAAAVLELIRSSIMSLPTYPTDGPKDALEERFSKVEKSWADGLRSRATKKAETDAKRAKDAKLSEGFKQRFKKTVDQEAPPPVGSPAEETPKGSKKKPDSYYEGWETQLRRTPVKDDGSGGELLQLDCNAETILSYEYRWREVLRYNEVTKEVATDGSPLENHEETPAQITTGVKYWLQRNWKLSIGTGDVQAAILSVAKRNAFDPLKDYLNGLDWDEEEHADSWLEKYCGVDPTPLSRTISRRWLVSAVARALDPGCKVDTVLIFEGGQGIKKSTMLKVMGGEYFCDSKINIDHNDAKMIAGSNWVIEMPELAALHASETESQKAFFSSATDKFRPPYGRVTEKFHRRCVFVGSTNDERYMNDITGNRRYLPVKCGKFEIRKAKRDRDQIWAHAVEIYKAGFTCPTCIENEERCEEHRWWLDEEENKLLEEENNKRLKNEYADAIVDYILKLAPPTPGSAEKKLRTRPESYTMFEIASTVLGIPSERVNSQQAAIGRALKALGFEKERLKLESKWQPWRHILPEELLFAPQKGSEEDMRQEAELRAERVKAREAKRHLHAVPNTPMEEA